MPQILFDTFSLVLVLSDFGLTGTFPFLGPLVILPLGISPSRPPVGYTLVLVPVFCCCGGRIFGRESNHRYAHIIVLYF